jgi:hypothetical protein
MAIVSFLEINVCGLQDTQAMSTCIRGNLLRPSTWPPTSKARENFSRRRSSPLRKGASEAPRSCVNASLKDIRVGRIRGGVVAGASVLPSPWTLSKSAEAESCLYLPKATQSLVFVLAPDRRPVGASPLALLVAATIDLSQCPPAVCSDDAVVSGC